MPITQTWDVQAGGLQEVQGQSGLRSSRLARTVYKTSSQQTPDSECLGQVVGGDITK